MGSPRKVRVALTWEGVMDEDDDTIQASRRIYDMLAIVEKVFDVYAPSLRLGSDITITPVLDDEDEVASDG